ncbi:ABC transporter [Zymomonas mobilis subsp. pomaceae]|nr:ABC transporter [Zymomonas mobilis subsp. pomaceae]
MGLFTHSLVMGMYLLGDPDSMTDAAIRLEHIAIAYNQKPVWSDLTLTLASGSLTAIVGPNGAGKSTLLKALLGEISLTSGHINRNNIKPSQYGYLPQAKNIDRNFPISVFDLALSGMLPTMGAFKSISQSQLQHINACLSRVGLNGLENRSINALSGGQFQRLLFGRLLVQDAQIIILDEPFVGIDIATIRELEKIIIEWHQEGRTVIAALHEIEQVARLFPQTLLMAHQKGLWGKTENILTTDHLNWAYGYEIAAPVGMGEINTVTADRNAVL